MAFAFTPLAIGAGVAAANGVVASSDVNAGRTALSSRRSLWVKGGAILAGVVGEFMGWPEDVSESLMESGTVLAVNELAVALAQRGKGSSAVPAQGQRYEGAWAHQPQPRPRIAERPAPAMAEAQFFSNRRREPAGIAG